MSKNPMKVLIVDDVPDGADTLAHLIRLQAGCRVATSYSGEEAVATAVAFRPDVVITDLTMPGMDGLQTARAIRSKLSDAPPLMLLMTGDTVVRDELDQVDAVFDQAFAKPVDSERLMAAIAGDRQHGPASPVSPGSVDAFEVLTDAVRQAAPRAKTRGLTLAFDCVGSRVRLLTHAVGLGRDFDRIVGALLSGVVRGFVGVTGEVSRGASGIRSLTVKAMGAGRLCGDMEAAALIQGLGLKEVAEGRVALKRAATGVSLETGATITVSMEPSKGLLISWRLDRGSQTWEVADPARQLVDAMLWLIDIDGAYVGGVANRFSRLGWTVSRLASCSEAIERLASAAERAPEMVCVLEGDPTMDASSTRLAASLPRQTQFVVAHTGDLEQGMGTDASPHARRYPFSPADLDEFTRTAADRGAATVGGAGHAASSPDAENRKSVLLVDDIEVNRVVGRAMIEALGYHVATCSDGLDAIDYCIKSPPDIVLMDLDMAVLDGHAATARLRLLQREGRLPPFGIVAWTSHQRNTLDVDDGQLDGYLGKPLDSEQLVRELQRFVRAPA